MQNRLISQTLEIRGLYHKQLNTAFNLIVFSKGRTLKMPPRFQVSLLPVTDVEKLQSLKISTSLLTQTKLPKAWQKSFLASTCTAHIFHHSQADATQLFLAFPQTENMFCIQKRGVYQSIPAKTDWGKEGFSMGCQFNINNINLLLSIALFEASSQTYNLSRFGLNL